jgi:hypothetical protein
MPRRIGQTDGGNAGGILKQRRGILPSKFGARHKGMLETESLPFAGQFELVVGNGFHTIALPDVARGLHLVQRRRRQRARRQHHFRNAELPLILAQPERVADGKLCVQVVLGLCRQHIDLGLQEVAVIAIEVGIIDRRRPPEIPGQSIIGNVVGFFMQVAQCQPRRRAQPQRQ